MQTRPPSMISQENPPIPPFIPLQAINSLIPRLTTTINDIDAFKILLASGNADGSMPNWDTLLQRYSLLLGRINALSTYLAQPPPQPKPSTTRPPPPAQNPLKHPALSQYAVHPLDPLPDETNANPLAPETFFQVINTQRLPSVSSNQSSLLSSSPWLPLDRLKKMDERELEVVRKGFRERFVREGRKVEVIREEIERREEDLDWGMRIGLEDDENEGEGEGEGEEEDLFGEDEGVEGDEDMGSKGEGEERPDGGSANPRQGWTVRDYVDFMASGKESELKEPLLAQPT